MNLFAKTKSSKTCLQKGLDKERCICGKELAEPQTSPAPEQADRKLFNKDKKPQSLFEVDVMSDSLKP